MTRLTILFLLTSVLHMNAVELDVVDEKFKNFDYPAVILLADSLLNGSEKLSNEQKLTLYQLKGISFFSLLEMQQSLACFSEILKIDPGHTMDPVQTSPKILAFFNQIKTCLARKDTVVVAHVFKDTVTVTQYDDRIRHAVSRSMIFPGWGHYYSGQKTKGKILAGVSVICLGAAIYYTADCNRAHQNYMREVDPRKIGGKYDIWNTLYQKRNVFILSYTAIWLYAQTDILFFSVGNKKVTLSASPTALHMTCQF
ncbi:hypothetical protein JW935_13965 [candidate division KSB1 bacterium]|nr:hypothetical protein [candidate division KSB1 bacterium]